MKKITVAGNILLDKIKFIEIYPKEGMLTKIIDMQFSIGGCVPNILIDLSKMEGDIVLSALGRIGDDEDGKYLIRELMKYDIDISGIKIDNKLPTSFTDVMTVNETGNRTFFYNAGASSLFCLDDIDVDVLDCDIFHIGYILLLEYMDSADNEYGTKLARLLSMVQKRGIKTSIDVVSNDSGKFKDIVSPALKYCDYAIINEIEAGNVTDISPRNEKSELCEENIKKMLVQLKELGVKEKVIIHAVEGGFMLDSSGSYHCVPSLSLPHDYIVGSVGAGDAFCAGCLYGILKNYSNDEILRYASLAAACNLSKADSVSGLRSEADIRKLEKRFERRKSI